jgi:hypothetical protein
MKSGRITNDATTSGLSTHANITTAASDTADRADEKQQKDTGIATQLDPSGLTSRGTTRQLPSAGLKLSESDIVMAKYRAAQASALFDPESMALLESFTRKPFINYEDLAESVGTPVTCVKLGILMRAYLVEPLDNGVRVTPEGLQALDRVNRYLSILDKEHCEPNWDKGL